MFTIRYMKCGRKWRVVAHGGGVVNEGFYCITNDCEAREQTQNCENLQKCPDLIIINSSKQSLEIVL